MGPVKYFNSRPREGANPQKLSHVVTSLISIHAPARGQTGSWPGTMTVICIFQFTPPRGGKRRWRRSAGPERRFQFTPPRGGKRKSLGGGVVRGLFQFTPPRGGKPSCQAFFFNIYYFNSRPREGANPTGQRILPLYSISIHAPARGQTAKLHNIWRPSTLSIVIIHEKAP